MEKILNFIKSKKGLVTIALIILLIIIFIYFVMNKKDYKVFLDMYMPKDSYGYIKYSPGNENEFNLYKNSYLNIEYSFSDKKNREIEYVIEDNNIVSIENDKLIAKNTGTSKIYIKTKDNIESNYIIVNVVNDNE